LNHHRVAPVEQRLNRFLLAVAQLLEAELPPRASTNGLGTIFGHAHVAEQVNIQGAL
jgi:hypothetical protein